MKKRLYLIDGSSYIYRAFYAVSGLTNSKGLPTNAIFGFSRMLIKILEDEKPDYVCVVFDTKAKTFRHKAYDLYKANRPKMPDDLVPQIEHIHRLVEIFNIPTLSLDGFEADDLIGTLAKNGEKEGLQVIIVSGDKDMMQLLGADTFMLDTMKQKTFAIDDVIEKFGVEPSKVVEVMGLMGDSSDNVPGVPGIGPKTAKMLITEFGDIENLLRNIDKVSKKSTREKLREHAEMARLSRYLVTIDNDVSLDMTIDQLKNKKVDNRQLFSFFKEMEFHRLIKELNLGDGEKVKGNYRVIYNADELRELAERIKGLGYLSIDTETTGIDPLTAELVGISISLIETEGYYIPIRHNYPGVPAQLSIDEIRKILRPALENPEILKYGQNIKYDSIILANAGVRLKGIAFDTMIASYLINPSAGSYNLTGLAHKYLNIKMTDYKDVVGNRTGFQGVPIEKGAPYACADSDVTLRLMKKLAPLLKSDNLGSLFEQIEIPLIEVLQKIEMAGVKIDEQILAKKSKGLEKQLSRLEKEIHASAGIEFNINSPKQLADILFNRLQLKSVRKTKTGFSTDMKVLEKLAKKHPLPATILEYRQLMKLKSTYVDALPKMVNSRTGRIHTSYNQTVTATGRLSSSKPNLQNIPIRTEAGRGIRAAFITEAENLLVSADYSQIELRVLAHISGDNVLVQAFQKGEDIHERTALELFDVLPGTVTADMRRTAKTVNFGIVYGISAFGLSEGLGVSRPEAAKFIDSYLNRYSGVREYMKSVVEDAREKGYVTTLLNRRRYLPELKSSNRQVREFAERMAVNTPIQGTAADIIKIAMINVSGKIQQMKLNARIIMQVHDELVLEASENEIEKTIDMVRIEMESVLSLSVPLIVDIHSGKNWNEAH